MWCVRNSRSLPSALSLSLSLSLSYPIATSQTNASALENTLTAMLNLIKQQQTQLDALRKDVSRSMLSLSLSLSLVQTTCLSIHWFTPPPTFSWINLLLLNRLLTLYAHYLKIVLRWESVWLCWSVTMRITLRNSKQLCSNFVSLLV